MNQGKYVFSQLMELKTAIPEFIQITPAAVHEVNILDNIIFQPDGFYIVDRGYTDFGRLYNIHKAKAFFITRAKDNFNFSSVSSVSVKKKYRRHV